MQPSLVKSGVIHYTVFYAKALPDPTGVPDTFDERDYNLMGEFDAFDLDDLFRQLQDPTDVAFTDKCRSLKTHALMTPGDVARDEAGSLWACDFSSRRTKRVYCGAEGTEPSQVKIDVAGDSCNEKLMEARV